MQTALFLITNDSINPNVKIISSLGELNLPVKVLAFNYKDDIVCMQYSVDETIKEIIIEYGEK